MLSLTLPISETAFFLILKNTSRSSMGVSFNSLMKSATSCLKNILESLKRYS